MEHAAMREAAIKKQLADLIQAITSSPYTGRTSAGSLHGVCNTDASSHETAVSNCLDHLRLQVKYLLFDLEATRRENRYLRQMLESRHRRDLEDFKGDLPSGP